MSIAKQEVLSEIFGAPGYSLRVSLRPDELQMLRLRVSELWADQLRARYPQLVEQFVGVGIDKYHTLSESVEHDTMWPRSAREVPRAMAEEICKLDFFSRLEAALGPYIISDYEGSGFQDFTWRLCRPCVEHDVGPLHTDGSFWVLEQKKSPEGHVRVKCWMALYNEEGLSGLKVVPDSHKNQNPYHSDTRHGRMKPTLLNADASVPVLPPMGAGSVILFHDNLLHGGAVGYGDATRVSLEFTLFVRKDSIAPYVSPGYPLEVDYQPVGVA